MTSRAYYNEHDRKAAAWLRALIADNHIAPGDVDERSIADVTPGDVAGYTQAHFFAGIGVWSYALRRAGWDDARPVWTGSCPCQPFSGAGKQEGFTDERHLWPEFFRLIRERRPGVVFGEQVASKDGLAWLDLVSTDLEGAGYAIGAVDLCAAGLGAPHIRQRLYWVADTVEGGRPEFSTSRLHDYGQSGDDAARCGPAVRMDSSIRTRLEGHGGYGDDRDESGRLDAIEIGSVATAGAARGMADAHVSERGRGQLGLHAEDGNDHGPSRVGERPEGSGLADAASGGRGEFGDAALARRSGHTDSGILAGFWRDADWIYCRDEKWRPVEPRSFPLAHGAPARVGRLRGYGNAIVAEVAETFIASYLDVIEGAA